jgi:hypothetical protein
MNELYQSQDRRDAYPPPKFNTDDTKVARPSYSITQFILKYLLEKDAISDSIKKQRVWISPEKKQTFKQYILSLE